MSLDIKYRPIFFRDVVGQADIVSILQQKILKGEACHSSYIFAGLSGTGKTTTARILARSILCPNRSPDGEPCNQCQSCKDILEKSDSLAFSELDAANNSGKDTIKAIVDSLQYSTFGSAERKIYLIDEAHRLSADAMDALLKPMEDTIPGTRDRRLVCLFCTTEPDKIRTAIRSRSMMFRIMEPTHEDLVARMAYICKSEGFPYDLDALSLIVDQAEGHVRDMVHAVERTSAFGSVTLDNVVKALGLATIPLYFNILKLAIQQNQEELAPLVHDVLKRVSAPQLYEGLLDALLELYSFHTLGNNYKTLKVSKAIVEDTYKEFNSISQIIMSAKILRDCIAEGGPSGSLLSSKTLLIDLFRMLNPITVQASTPIVTAVQNTAAQTSHQPAPQKVNPNLPWRVNPPPPPVVPDSSPYVNQNRKVQTPEDLQETSSAPLVPDKLKIQVKDAQSEFERYLQLSTSYSKP